MSKFMEDLEAKRLKILWSVVVMAEEMGVDKKQYLRYRDGVQTPPPEFVLKAVDTFGREVFR